MSRCCMTITCTAAACTNPTTRKSELKGIRKPRPVSPEMQELVSAREIPRSQALKLISIEPLDDVVNKEVQAHTVYVDTKKPNTVVVTLIADSMLTKWIKSVVDSVLTKETRASSRV
ncbi:hypothetical protein ACFE04_011362 [Oxalis oulophora]